MNPQPRPLDSCPANRNSPRRLIAAVIAFAAVLCGAHLHATPVIWSGNGHSYEVVTPGGLIDWNSANSTASAMGGHLATLTSPAENAFVYSLVSNPSLWFPQHGIQVSGPWLGGFRASANILDWHWVTGEAFAYSNWELNQPDNGSPGINGEDALHFFAYGSTPDSTWNDAPHEAQVAYALIVEFEVPEPSTASLAIAGVAAWLTFRTRRPRVSS